MKQITKKLLKIVQWIQAVPNRIDASFYQMSLKSHLLIGIALGVIGAYGTLLLIALTLNWILK